jgi:hypothetical protein
VNVDNTLTAEDLAEALVAHPKFKWLPRMHTRCGWTVILNGADGVLIEAAITGSGEVALFIEGRPVRYALESEHVKNWIPDLADPGTGGCLWAMVLREGIPSKSDGQRGAALKVECGYDSRIFITRGKDIYAGDTLGEASARALLTLWGTVPNAS